MVVFVLYPRFELVAALRDRRALLSKPTALASQVGDGQAVGAVSPSAEAFGVQRGMRLGEALARCPEIQLVPADPEHARTLWGALLDRLEGIGATVESYQAGEACFSAQGLYGVHGGELDGVLRITREVVGSAVRIGAGPSRFSSHAAALEARARRHLRPPLAAPLPGTAVVVPAAVAAFLASLPVALLRTRPELGTLPDVLERLGIRTLGELAALPRRAVAERFGPSGLLASDLAQGRDTPLEPRRPSEPVVERLELPEMASGLQLERALELLVTCVLARRERRGRSIRALAVSAFFVAGGTWRTSVTLRKPSADPARIRLALATRMTALPAPAESVSIEVESFGPPALDQPSLLETGQTIRHARLREGVRQARQAVGDDAVMHIHEVNPRSRVPERRATLVPFTDAG